MKNGAFTFTFLLAVGAVAATSSLAGGCSSDPEQPPQQQPDAAADTAVDTKPETAPADTKESGPISCAQDLPGDFKCQPPPDKPGKKVCTDAMLTEFINCFGSGDTKKCQDAIKKYPACNTCVLKDWLSGDPPSRIDVAACIKKIDPAHKCSTTIQCAYDCLSLVCSECDTTDGTSRTGRADRSEYDDCSSDAEWRGSATRPKGRCYDIAIKDFGACRDETKFSYCFVSTLDDVKNFFRGACRDGGDWTKADQPDGTEGGGDAGTDTGVEVGVDTGVPSDSGVEVAVDVGSDG